MGDSQAKFAAVLVIFLSLVWGAAFVGTRMPLSSEAGEVSAKSAVKPVRAKKPLRPPHDDIAAAKLMRRIKPHKININTADVEELMKLPGVGRTLATRIVKYRKKHGHFRSVNQLIKVKGIGPKKLKKIKKMATI